MGENESVAAEQKGQSALFPRNPFQCREKFHPWSDMEESQPAAHRSLSQPPQPGQVAEIDHMKPA